MDRLRRDEPEDKVRTSHLIQQLAAQRERKQLQAQHTGSAGDDVAAASCIPLPGSFDEGDDLQPPAAAAADNSLARGTSSKPRSRLVRQDKASQQVPTPGPPPPAAAAAARDEVEGLADLLQSVGLSSTAASSSSRQPAQQQQQQPPFAFRPIPSAAAGAGTTHSSETEEDIEDYDTDGSAAAELGDSATQQHRWPAVSTTTGRSATHPGPSSTSRQQQQQQRQEEEEGDVDSVDSADSDSSQGAAGSSSTQQVPHADGPSAAAAAAEALVLEGGFSLDGPVAAKLYPHQIQGVKWLWSLHRMGKGGILADDMGLGKTMQCSALLAGALAASRSSSSFMHAHPTAAAAGGSGTQAAAAAAAPVPVRALIVAPKTLLAHWEKELRVCDMGRATHSYYGSSEGERATVLTAITRRGGIMLTTYGMVLHNATQLMSGKGCAVARDIDENEDEEDPLCPEPPPGRRILWDYIILDEGHKIKNARTQLAQRLREIRARVRIIISGTPVQNNLGELHALMEFATPGLLGSAKDFKTAYEKPINAGQDRSATLRVRELGAARAAELRQLVAPYILRREKKEVLGDGTNTNSSSGGAAGQQGGTTASGGIRGVGGVVAAAAAATGSASGLNNPASSSSSSTPAAAAAAAAAGRGGAAGPAPMGKKTDLVVWLRLTALQRHIYEAFLHSDAVKAALNSSKSPLAALTVLKKVCDHPALLSERATKLVVSAAAKPSRRKGLDTSASLRPGGSQSAPRRRNSLDDFIVDDEDSGGDESSGYDSEDSDGGGSVSAEAAAARAAVAASLDTFSEEFLSWATAGGGEDLEQQLLSDVGARGTESSCKSLFVAALLDELVAGGHRTLVFSQSRVMLDILQAAVKARGWNFCRIDGSVVKAEARQAEVERFQTAAGGAKGIPVFLLTTQVGGLGLTLTAADRVVIVDPSFNPSVDNQSVDRAYRIGQSKDVVVYRLVTCGTVEEKIYRKQVFKGGLSKAGMEEGIQLRYFTHQELHELFKWDPDALSTSETQQLLKQQHAPQLRALQKQQGHELNSHVGWLETNPLCAGTTQHGLLFSLQDPEGKDLNLKDPSLSTAAAAAAAGSGGGRFRDSGWHPRKGAGSRGPGQAGGFWGSQGGAAGSSGGGGQPASEALDEMMQALNIAGGSGSGRGAGLTAAGARGSLSHVHGGGGQQQQQQQRVQELAKRVKQLQGQVQSSSLDLQQLGPRLPDGGAKIAAKRDHLQAELDQALAELRQADPEAAAALTAAAAAAAPRAPGSINAASPAQQQQQPAQPPPPSQQQQQSGPGRGQGLLRPYQQQQQQPWQQPSLPPQFQEQPWQQRPPPPPRQQQQHWTDSLPQPPAGRPQQQPSQSGGSSSGSNPAAPQQQGEPRGGTSRPGSNSSGEQQQQRDRQREAVPPDVQTLDGRVPTVDELRQRKHVLKKALQREDRLKEQLRSQGRAWPADKQQQWQQMYVEYKEIKQVLQAVEEAEAAEEQQAGRGAAGVGSAGRGHGSRSNSSGAVIDLT